MHPIYYMYLIISLSYLNYDLREIIHYITELYIYIYMNYSMYNCINSEHLCWKYKLFHDILTIL